MTTFAKHDFPGLPNPVYLPDWLKVQHKIIPNGTWGWTSGQKINVKNFTSTTYHDTGNPNANAASDYRWAAGGGRGQMGSAGSYNGIFDANGLILTQRFDELVGHAANHTGNITSYAFEHAFGGPGNNFNDSWQVGMWVHAGVLQAMGRTADTSMYQHNFWSGKGCPGQIRAKGLWSATEKGVDDHIAEINAYLAGVDVGGEVKPPPVVYPKPSRIPALDAVSSQGGIAPSYVLIPNEKVTAFFVGDRYEAIRDTPRRQYAYAKSPDIGPNIRKGESFDVDFVFQNQDGYWAYTPYGTRVMLDDLKRVSDSKGEQEAA